MSRLRADATKGRARETRERRGEPFSLPSRVSLARSVLSSARYFQAPNICRQVISTSFQVRHKNIAVQSLPSELCSYPNFDFGERGLGRFGDLLCSQEKREWVIWGNKQRVSVFGVGGVGCKRGGVGEGLHRIPTLDGCHLVLNS